MARPPPSASLITYSFSRKLFVTVLILNAVAIGLAAGGRFPFARQNLGTMALGWSQIQLT